MKSKEAKNKNFKLFECAIPVRGAKRGIIYDLQRAKFDYVPLELISILENFDGENLQKIISHYGKENESVILEYFDFLLKEEYIFFTNLPKDSFPKLEIIHKNPYKISNLIIDVNSYTLSYLSEVYKQVETLGCECLLFKFLEIDNEKLLLKALEVFQNSSCKSMEIIIRDQSFLNERFINELCISHMKIMKFSIFGGQDNSVKILKPANVMLVNTTTEILGNSKHKVYFTNFMVNMNLFMESKLYNNYYNRKVVIDGLGNIKNSPHSNITFGNIKSSEINTVINNVDFQSLWKVNKDNIKGCQDCEYRYMCVDANVPVKNGEYWELKEECNYDPYQSIWKSFENCNS